MTKSTRLNTGVIGALAVTMVLWGSVPLEAPVVVAPVVVAPVVVAPVVVAPVVVAPVVEAPAFEAPVADAAMRGEVDHVRTLLRGGADVNAAQGDGMTALHWAAENGDPELAEMLVQAGGNVGAVTRLGGYTPLHLAARRGRAGVVVSLLRAGADPTAVTSTGGVAPLHYAAAAGSNEAVLALLAHGADVDVTEAMWAQTPLMYAAAAGRSNTAKVLLEHGADPGVTARVLDLGEREGLDQADRRRETEVTDQIRAAAEGTAPSRGGDRFGRGGQRGGPPQAGRGGQAGGAPAGRGGRVGGSAQADRGGATGAPQAGRGGQEAPTRDEILQAQRDRRPTGRLSHAQLVGGYGGLTALLLAVREGHRTTVRELLEAGADINQVSAGDQTSPLLMATINGHFDLALEMLSRGADPNIGSHANATPLYTTINTQWIPKSRHPQPADYMQQQVSYLELMKAFLDAGADVNARLEKQLWYTTFGDDYLRTDRTGATAFWRAAYALDLPAMRLLLEYGADASLPTIKTSEGRSFGRGDPTASQGGATVDPSGLPPVPVGGPGAFPIHAASGIGYGEGYAANIHRVVPDGWLPAVRFLVEELGADVNARDSNGFNAVHHAAARGDDELIRYLVSKGADATAVSRRGQTTVDMANGPVQRISPFPSTIALLESLGAVNNHNCVSC